MTEDLRRGAGPDLARWEAEHVARWVRDTLATVLREQGGAGVQLVIHVGPSGHVSCAVTTSTEVLPARNLRPVRSSAKVNT